MLRFGKPADPVSAWIDLALYGAGKEPAGLDWTRLQKRVHKRLEAYKPGAIDKALMRMFSEAVGCWARVEEKRIAEYLPPATVRRLVDLAPPTTGDPVMHASLRISQYLNDSGARLTCTRGSGDHLEFFVQADYMIQHLAIHDWLNWIENPVRAMECEHCGIAFHPTRSDARFCSTACRTAAARDRREATA